MKISILVLVCVAASMAHVMGSSLRRLDLSLDSSMYGSSSDKYLPTPTAENSIRTMKEAHLYVKTHLEIPAQASGLQQEAWNGYHGITNALVKKAFIKRYIDHVGFLIHLIIADADDDLKLYFQEATKVKSGAWGLVKQVLIERPDLKSSAIKCAKENGNTKLVGMLEDGN